jgi:hypothetical protein
MYPSDYRMKSVGPAGRTSRGPGRTCRSRRWAGAFFRRPQRARHRPGPDDSGRWRTVADGRGRWRRPRAAARSASARPDAQPGARSVDAPGRRRLGSLGPAWPRPFVAGQLWTARPRTRCQPATGSVAPRRLAAVNSPRRIRSVKQRPTEVGCASLLRRGHRLPPSGACGLVTSAIDFGDVFAVGPHGSTCPSMSTPRSVPVRARPGSPWRRPARRSPGPGAHARPWSPRPPAPDRPAHVRRPPRSTRPSALERHGPGPAGEPGVHRVPGGPVTLRDITPARPGTEPPQHRVDLKTASRSARRGHARTSPVRPGAPAGRQPAWPGASQGSRVPRNRSAAPTGRATRRRPIRPVAALRSRVR